MIRLQIMICTYGREGIDRVVNSAHPEVEGVEYLVGWQLPDKDIPIPAELGNRKDFKIYVSQSRGLSKNRNFLLSNANAPILLISDDDVDYTSDQINALIDAFDKNPACDLISFRYESKNSSKRYHDCEFDLKKPMKGYFPTSFEIAFRGERIPKEIRFDERFGIGAEFPSGEEDLFLNDCLNKGFNCKYMPVVICRHDGNTTAERDSSKPSYIQTKGAVMSRLFPVSWFPRMLTHAIREYRSTKDLRHTFNYMGNWIKGVRRL